MQYVQYTLALHQVRLPFNFEFNFLIVAYSPEILIRFLLFSLFLFRIVCTCH